MMIKHLAVLAAALMISSTAAAQTIRRIPLTPSQNPTNADLPFSQAVWAGDTLYVSGWLDPDVKTHTDIKSQAVGILEDMQKFLASQKLTLGDVVMMRVYIGGDPTKDFRGDALEARAGFRQFFGTKDQPNKPACTTVHVPLPAAPRGVLVEIDVPEVVFGRPRGRLTRSDARLGKARIAPFAAVGLAAKTHRSPRYVDRGRQRRLSGGDPTHLAMVGWCCKCGAAPGARPDR
ncbi:MAG TPA: Rid family hydrolase [Steroidobacteraceae bacterium]|nr:Rid family hydrolase [Steroidobacteraceae bacterium]